MSTSESYDATKLLNNLNITNWDHHLREKLSAYPIMGKAIRKGIPYEVIKPTVDDIFEDGARMYSYREDSTNLDNESRKDFLSACTHWESWQQKVTKINKMNKNGDTYFNLFSTVRQWFC